MVSILEAAYISYASCFNKLTRQTLQQCTAVTYDTQMSSQDYEHEAGDEIAQGRAEIAGM